ncbi:hypothetical protein HK18_02710 [Commensalibacter intestini]|uniref:Uncharacterized protein n=1 Tax=Commensalibacter intestini TaxID=479936 RepID=A0A251ZXV8_9PROT|nr:hypothetical protein [Commensalibacter intestini]OUI79483.1 hypothetical protein HK18_02710 [Commensalibacter intestini]
MSLILAHHSVDQIIPITPEVTNLYTRLTTEISRLVSPQHALLFAEPKTVKNTIDWYAEGKEFTPWKDLSEVKQKEALQVIQSTLVDITSAARLHPRSLLSRSLPACGCFPSLEDVYIVDGRPVLTKWGYREVNGFYNPLANHTTKITQQARRLLWSHFPWITALVALFLGVVTSLLWNIYHHSNKSCYATYPLLKDVEEALKTQDQNKDLTNKQGALLNALEVLKQQCKIPSIQPLKPQDAPELGVLPDATKVPDVPTVPPIEKLPNIEAPKQQEIPQPKPTPQPQKKVDFPKDAWDKKDKSMLNGCWHLTTPLKLVTRGAGIWTPVESWKVCFNQSGNGNQTIVKSDNTSCHGPVSAYFQGEQLIIKQPGNCNGSFFLVQGTQVCTRVSDTEARCLYNDDDRPSGNRVPGIFKR